MKKKEKSETKIAFIPHYFFFHGRLLPFLTVLLHFTHLFDLTKQNYQSYVIRLELTCKPSLANLDPLAIMRTHICTRNN